MHGINLESAQLLCLFRAALANVWTTHVALELHWLVFGRQPLLTCFTGYYFADANGIRASLDTISNSTIAISFKFILFGRTYLLIL